MQLDALSPVHDLYIPHAFHWCTAVTTEFEIALLSVGTSLEMTVGDDF